MGVLTETLIAGQSIPQPELFAALKEIDENIEKINKAFHISPDNQVGMAIDPNPNLILDLNDTTRRLALGLPQLTLTEKLAIPNPPNGALVFDTTLNLLSFFNAAFWRNLGYQGFDLSAIGSVGAAETRLLSVRLPPGLLSFDGQVIDINWAATAAANANLKQVKAYFSTDNTVGTGTVISTSGAPAALSGIQQARIQLIRSGKAAEISLGTTTYATHTLDTTIPLYINVTGTGVANNDLVGNFLVIRG